VLLLLPCFGRLEARPFLADNAIALAANLRGDWPDPLSQRPALNLGAVAALGFAWV